MNLHENTLKQEQVTKLEELAAEVKRLVASSATSDIKTDYLITYDDLCAKHKIEEIRYNKLLKEKMYRITQAKAMRLFISTVKDKSAILDEWNDKLRFLLVDKAVVHKDKIITFIFKNKKEIKIEAE